MEGVIIKKAFVQKILREESQRLERNQGLEMRKLLHFHTGILERERDFKISTESGMDGQLRFKHKAYQRFLDLRKNPKIKNGRKIRKRNYPIHNRFVFGHYYVIANRLMVEFTNEVRDGIKREIENNHG